MGCRRNGGYRFDSGFRHTGRVRRRLAEQLLATGTARRASIAIQPATLTQEIARRVGTDPTNGVVVMQIATPSSTAKAGIQTGDIVTAFNVRNRDGRGARRGTWRHQTG
jgi:serine protease Do